MAFGIARDIFGAPNISLKTKEEISVEELLQILYKEYPPLRELRSLAIAVNAEYADTKQIIKSGDEVVIIPPVAGG